MQPPTDGPRAGYTVDQVTYLVENSSSFQTDMGLQLLDQSLNVLDDVSDFLHGCTVSRDSYADLHAQCTFTIDQPLDWGNSIVRPYMKFTGPTSATSTALTTMTFYLGAYVTDTPEEDLSAIPSTFDATGFDLLSLLDDAVGDAYSVDAGVGYLDRVEEIFQNRGFTQYVIDPDQRAVTVASPITYTMDDNTTWLTIVNNLLSGVGYAGVWADWNGVLRAEPYIIPSDRSPEWTMTDETATTLLTQRRKRRRDFYNAPNRWVVYRNSNTEGTQPVPGNGIYEFVNQSNGPTSVDARGGRVITKVTGIDASSQLALQFYALRQYYIDRLIPTKISIDTAPFPLAWHFDRLAVSDASLGSAIQVMASAWTLNLDGSDMSWDWSVL